MKALRGSQKTVILRRTGNVLAFLGMGVGMAGAAAVAVGGVLPWAMLTIFGVPLALPGVLNLWGAVAIGLAALAFTWSRAFPWLWLVLGLAAMYIGMDAEKTVGREVVRFKLHVERALLVTNARLAQATLPPIEPFSGIGPAREHLGPGPFWVFWGGVTLAGGGTCQLLGARLRRTCGNCGTFWSSRRDGLSYCPRCGTAADDTPHCANCRRALERNDRFCASCGQPAERAQRSGKSLLPQERQSGL